MATELLGCGSIPLGIVAFVSYNTADRGMDTIHERRGFALKRNPYSQLTRMRAVKKQQIEMYFEERTGGMGVLLETAGTPRNEVFSKPIAVRASKKNQFGSHFRGRIAPGRHDKIVGTQGRTSGH